MRPGRAIIAYLIFVFAGGALIAPWLYAFVQWVSGHLPIAQSVASKPFPRYVNRALLGLALIGLVPLLRAAGMRSWSAVGLVRRPDAAAQVGWGFLIGFLSLAMVVVLAVAGGGRFWSRDLTLATMAAQFIKAAVTAALVATIEEIVFRGALFGALRRSFSWRAALVWSSALYALLHFLERPGPIGQVDWHSGFVVLWAMAGGFANVTKLVPGFLNLAIVGVILGLVYHRSGALYASIGLHAGWIFWLKSYGFATDATEGSPTWFFGSSKLVDGWLALIVLSASFIIVPRLTLFGNKARTAEIDGESPHARSEPDIPRRLD